MGKKRKTQSAADAPAEESPTPTDDLPAAEEAAAPSPEVAGDGSTVAQKVCLECAEQVPMEMQQRQESLAVENES